MDLIHLETFVTLVRFRNFSRVAKYMEVSQPTVTIRIKALEDELGTALMIRTGNKISLTPAGQVFYDYIERSLRILRKGMNIFSSHNGAEEKRLSILATPTVGTYFIPYFLSCFSKSHLGWEVALDIGSTSHIAELILDEVAHLGFVSSHFEHPDIVRISLYQDQFFLVSHPKHSLVEKESISVFDLRHEFLISYEKGCSMSFRIESLFREVGIQSNVGMELNHSDTIKRMVLEGNGIAFLPWIAIQKEVRKKQLAILPLQLPKPIMRETSIIFKKNTLHNLSVCSFLNVIKQQHSVFSKEYNLEVFYNDRTEKYNV